MDEYLRKLAAAPLANPLGLNLPQGKRQAPKQVHQPSPPRPGDLTRQQVRERREKAITAKQEALLDYYATTDLPAERVAEHVGLHKLVKVGEREEGDGLARKVVEVFEPRPDVERVAGALAWRRKQAGK